MTLRKKSTGHADSSRTGDGWSRGPGPRRDRSGAAHLVLVWIDECVRDKIWWIRVPLLAWMAWIWAHHVSDPQYESLIKGLNLGIHELGHIVFGFGEFLSIAGGTLLQCLVPLVGMVMFVRQRDPFAVCFAFGWLGTNFMDVAVYASDARAMELPLVSPFAGDEIGHDWNLMLGRLGGLAHDQAVAGLFRFLGHASFAVSLVGGGWVLWKMSAGQRSA